MSTVASEQIGEGEDGRGSRPTPAHQPCKCVVQVPVQQPVQTVQVSGDCTDDCTSTIVVTGIRGGAGASTVAAVLALLGRTMVPTELVTSEPDQLAALLGVSPPEDLSVEVLLGLRLATAPSGSAELTIVDAGALTGTASGPHRPGERRLGVLRGPCYLALRSLLADGQQGLDGLVLVAEPGRALTERDVTDVTGLDVVATVPANPAVARTIDAGLLASRLTARPEFRSLRRWLGHHLDPFPPRAPPTRSTAPLDPQRPAQTC